MNEPKRWAEASSDVDPVVRSLLRHAQSRGPSELEVARLVARVEGASSPSALRAARRRRAVRAAAWLAVAAISSVVGAVVGPRLGIRASSSDRAESKESPYSAASSESSKRLVAHPSEPRVAVPASSPGETEPHGAPAAARSEPTPHAPVSAREPDAHRTAPVPPSSAAMSTDLDSLTEARRVLASDPARALALTEASTRDHPASPFAEERAALAVEALLRLGRSDEAKLRLSRFEQAFPSSPYRRRLNAWQNARSGASAPAGDAH